MTSNAQLTGSVVVALDGSRVDASGQFTTADGWPQSESVDLTLLLTPATKQQVLLLIGSLEQQYAQMRQNLLPQAKFLLADQSYLAGVLGATVAADPSLAYAGQQSAKVTTPGAAAGEGVALALGTVPRASVVAATVLVLLPAGLAIQATLIDTANTVDTYTAVSPATTPPSYARASAPLVAVSAEVTGGAQPAWQAVTATLAVGSANSPTLTLRLVTTARAAGSFWLGAVQLVAQGG